MESRHPAGPHASAIRARAGRGPVPIFPPIQPYVLTAARARN